MGAIKISTKNLTTSENMVTFKDVAEAEKKGYEPCKTCIPAPTAAKPTTKTQK